MKKIIIPIAVLVFVIVFAIAGYLDYQNKLNIQKQKPVACTMDAKACPDGSFVGRIAPNCEFAQCPEGVFYKNSEYGFQITLPNTWKGYLIENQKWQGWTVDTGKQDYSGVKIVIKNPQTTATQKWQDIPVMVFAPDVWKLISEEKISVSAAPIPPAKIGENSKYVFATPPRWYGFTDDIGWQEAVDIVKTFKAF